MRFAEATAFIDAVFMLVSNDKAVPPFNVKSFSYGCDYKKIHTGLVSWSNDDGATIVEVHPTQQSRFDAEQQKLDKQLDKSLNISRC